MRVYLSGPISDMPQGNRPAFDRAADSLRASGYTVVTPFEIFTEPPPVCPDATQKRAYWRRAMRACIKALPEYDAIALLPGWECSEGAKAEKWIADLLGMRPIFLQQEAR